MSISLIVGFKGDGKTIFLTYLTYWAYIHDSAIFANYNLSFKHNKLNLADSYNSLQFENCMIAIDEAQMYIDSRNFGRKENKLLGYLFLQTRKRGVDVAMAAHQGSMIDIRVRENLDYVYRTTALVSNGVGYKRATIEEIEGQVVTAMYIEKYCVRSADYGRFLFDPKKYFDKYDTNEFVNIMEAT